MAEEPDGSPPEEKPQRLRWGAAKKVDPESDAVLSPVVPDSSDSEKKPRKKAGWRDKVDNVKTAEAEVVAPAFEPASVPSESDKEDRTKAKRKTATKVRRKTTMAKADLTARSEAGGSSHGNGNSAHWKDDPFKGKHINLKVMIISAANLRPDSHEDVVNTSCSCELLGQADKNPKSNTKWHTKSIHDSKHPTWKEFHVWHETDYTPGDQIKFTIHEHEHGRSSTDVVLGTGILDGRQFYPDGFEGKCALRDCREAGPDAHIRVKIQVEVEELQIQSRIREKKAKALAKDQAKKEQNNDKCMSPWETRIAGLTQTTQRVAPGQILKPRGTPVYKRLHAQHAENLTKQQEKIEAKNQALDDEAFELLYGEDGIKPLQATEEEVDEVFERLYGDHEKNQERKAESVRKKDLQLSEELGSRNPQEYEDPNLVISEVTERLYALEQAKQDKLGKMRAEQEQKEVSYMAEKSVHANVNPNEYEDPDVDEIFARLHGEHKQKQEKLKKRVSERDKDDVKDINKVFTYPKFTEKGVRLTIMSARNLTKPEDAHIPEPCCICTCPVRTKGILHTPEGTRESMGVACGVDVRTKGVKWKNSPTWNQVFDLTEMYDGESPLKFTVMTDDFPVGRVLGRVVLDSADISDKGFEGELKLLPLSKAEESHAIMDKIKARLRAAGYSLGGLNLKKLHKHYDRDCNGVLSVNELTNSIRKDAKLTADIISDDVIRNIFSSIDTSEDGQISIEEFGHWLKPGDPYASGSDGGVDSDGGGGVGGVGSDGCAELGFSQSLMTQVGPQRTVTDEPEPSPNMDGTASDDPASPSQRGEVGAVILIKIQILPPKAQGKRAYLEKSVQRLYGRHFEVQDKLDCKKEAAQRQLVKQATPKVEASMPKVEGDSLEFYRRLYADAHRRHADRRISQKESLRKLKMAQDEDSVHTKAMRKKAWQPEEVDNIFERIYNPPPKCFKIKLHTQTPDNDEPFYLEEPAQLLTGPLTSRRMGMFYNRHLNSAPEVDEDEEDEDEPLQTPSRFDEERTSPGHRMRGSGQLSDDFSARGDSLTPDRTSQRPQTARGDSQTPDRLGQRPETARASTIVRYDGNGRRIRDSQRDESPQKGPRESSSGLVRGQSSSQSSPTLRQGSQLNSPAPSTEFNDRGQGRSSLNRQASGSTLGSQVGPQYDERGHKIRGSQRDETPPQGRVRYSGQSDAMNPPSPNVISPGQGSGFDERGQKIRGSQRETPKQSHGHKKHDAQREPSQEGHGQSRHRRRHPGDEPPGPPVEFQKSSNLTLGERTLGPSTELQHSASTPSMRKSVALSDSVETFSPMGGGRSIGKSSSKFASDDQSSFQRGRMLDEPAPEISPMRQSYNQSPGQRSSFRQ